VNYKITSMSKGPCGVYKEVLEYLDTTTNCGILTIVSDLYIM